MCCVFSNVISHFVFAAYSLTGNSQHSAALWQFFLSLQAIFKCKLSVNLCACGSHSCFSWFLHGNIMFVRHSHRAIDRSSESEPENVGNINVSLISQTYAVNTGTRLHMKTVNRSLHINTNKHTHKQPWASPSTSFRPPIKQFPPPPSNTYSIHFILLGPVYDLWELVNVYGVHHIHFMGQKSCVASMSH